MKRYLLPIILGLSVSRPATADNVVGLGGEIQLKLPEGWVFGSDGTGYPFQLIHYDPTAELSIFRSEISAADALLNNDDLKLSVEKVVDDVILTLPGAKLLTSTGYFENHRTGFVIEFVSIDSTSHIPLRHRLNGILYRHPDGRQLLFTLWAKADAGEYPQAVGELKSIQNSFTYIGPQEESVFAAGWRPYWYAVVLTILVAGLLYVLRRRSGRTTRLPASSGSDFWRCRCEWLNRNELESCARCGKSRPGAGVDAGSVA